MGTIADKLSYLNTTKGKIKDSINLTGANIGNNDTFRSYSAKLRDSLVDIINNGTDELYDNFPKATGAGSEIELNNTYEAPMGIDLKGNTSQDSYSGKNLFDGEIRQGNQNAINVPKRIFSNNNYLKINAGETITFSTDLDLTTFDYAIYVEQLPFLTANNTQLYVSGYKQVSNFTFTSEYTGYLGFTIRYRNESDIMPNDVSAYHFQIEQGSTATDYEPYVGGTPSPNPDYPQYVEVVTGNNSINICGKNLFSGNNYIDNCNINSSGKIETGTYRIYYERVIAGETYTMSTGSSRQWVYSFFEDTPILNSIGNGRIVNTATNETFTVPNGYNYIAIRRVDGGGEVITNLMLNTGSTATTYEAYQGTTYPVNLGKNLFDKDNANSFSAYFLNTDTTLITSSVSKCIYIPIIGGKTYTISKIASQRFNVATTITLPTATTSILQNAGNQTAQGTINATNITISTSNNARYLVVWYYASNTDTLTEQQILDSLQIEEGNTASSYSPYKTPIEMCEIGDYQDEFRRSTGKNLLDTSSFYAGYINSSGVVTGDNKQALFDYIKVTPGTSYAISAQQTVASLNIALYDENKNFISRNVQTENPRTFTLPNTAYYVRIWFKYSDAYNMTQDIINNSKIQFEKNSTATEYEPYGIDTWYLHKEIGKVVLDGSENWQYYNRLQYITSIDDYKTSGLICLCSHYIAQNNVTGTGDMLDKHIAFRSENNNPNLYIKDTNFNDNVAFKSWLSNNNVIVYYILATPTDTEITDEELISQLNAIKNAMSKKDKTYITAKYVEGNQPFKIVASALLREE